MLGAGLDSLLWDSLVGAPSHRVLELQEAEPAGGDFGRAHVVIDDATMIEFFHNNIGNAHDFIVTGYWGDASTRMLTWQEVEP